MRKETVSPLRRKPINPLCLESVSGSISMQENHQQVNIDTELNQLSSRKLWQILNLDKVKGCSLDKMFINEVKKELIARNDFDEGNAWREPH